jgi:hypothetical protein
VSQPLDLGVTIERVRVRPGTPAGNRPRRVFVTGFLTTPTAPAPHDHHIVVHELRIDIEATLDASRARGLATQVAWELANQLADLQAERYPRIAGQHAAGGPIRVETLHLHLRGELARHPPSHHISTALMTAFQERVGDGL